MEPEVIIEIREVSFFVIRLLDSLQDVTVHLQFHTLLPRVLLSYRHDGSASAALLRLVFDRHPDPESTNEKVGMIQRFK